MSQRLDDSRPGHLLQVSARLAEFHAEALDLANTEAFANEAVDIDTAQGHLPSSLAGPQPNVLDNLGGDKR